MSTPGGPTATPGGPDDAQQEYVHDPYTGYQAHHDGGSAGSDSGDDGYKNMDSGPGGGGFDDIFGNEVPNATPTGAPSSGPDVFEGFGSNSFPGNKMGGGAESVPDWDADPFAGSDNLFQ